MRKPIVPNLLAGLKTPMLWVLWLWILMPSLVVMIREPTSYLRIDLPVSLKILPTLVFATIAISSAWFLLWMSAKGWLAKCVFLIFTFLMVLHGIFAVVYIFLAGKKFGIEDFLILKNNVGFLFWYLVQTEPAVLIGILGILLVAGFFTWLHFRLVKANSGHQEWGLSGLIVFLGFLGLNVSGLIIGAWSTPQNISPKKSQESYSYLAWSFKALTEIHPLLACLDTLVPTKLAVELNQSHLGGPILTPDAYGRMLRKDLQKMDFRNIVVVQVESMRFDLIGKKVTGGTVMPFVSSLAATSLNFTRAYANSSHTSYAELCAPLGLYPLRSTLPFFYRKYDLQPRFMLHDLLKPFGYHTMLFSSQYEEWSGMDSYWKTLGLDKYFDSDSIIQAHNPDSSDIGFFAMLRNKQQYAGNIDDAVTVAEFLSYLDTGAVDGKPFLVFFFLENGHFPYPLPKDFKGPFQPSNIDFPASVMHFPKHKLSIVRNAYWNAMSYMDVQLAKLYRGLVERGLEDKTIFVILGDHGEDLYDSGFATHAESLSDPVIHIPLIIHGKRLDPRVVKQPTSQVDIAPTLLGLLGLAPFPGHQGTNVLRLGEEEAYRRPLFFHANAILNQDGILVWPWKLLIDRKSNQLKLFNLEWGELTVGDQQGNYPKIVETLKGCLDDFRNKQLRYYAEEKFFRHFFPPKFKAVDLLWPQTGQRVLSSREVIIENTSMGNTAP
jgi:arylsulfatase A-like enzyme